MMGPLFPKWFDNLTEKLSEASTWDGGVIIAISFFALLASPFVKYLAIGGLVYGAWRIYHKEKHQE
jgi:hypothetical protein